MRYNYDLTPVSEMTWPERAGFAVQMALGLALLFGMLLMPLVLGAGALLRGDAAGGVFMVLVQLVFWYLFALLNMI